jgi:hypothetical protein
MRVILLKGFFRCRALSSVPNAWTRKRRSSFPLPLLKRQKLLAPTSFSQQASVEEEDGDEANGSSEEDEPRVNDMQSEESAGESEESAGESEESAGGSEELPQCLVKPKEGVDVASAPPGREKPSLYPYVVHFTAPLSVVCCTLDL